MTEWDFITNLLPMAPTLAILFFLWKAGLIKFRGENGAESAPEWARKLLEHFNETTTELLKRISEGVDKLDERGEASCRKLDTIIKYHEEMKEYGVKTREHE